MGQTKQKWTEEPWEIYKLKNDDSDRYADQWQVANKSPYAVCTTYTKADGERIIACTNALAGIEDPAKFVAEAKKCEDHKNYWLAEAAKFREQRDALLEAAGNYLSAFDEDRIDDRNATREILRSIVAKSQEKS